MSQLGLACHIYFSPGRCPLELAQGPSRVALAWHNAGSSTPFGVTSRVGAHAYIHSAQSILLRNAHSWGVPRGSRTAIEEPQILHTQNGYATEHRIAILAEGAIALSVTLSGGALFAS